MKYYGKAPVRISLCNCGDTDYYVEEMGWTNLINATLDSGHYETFLIPKKQKHINYSYENTFTKKNFKKVIYDLKTSTEFTILITKTIEKIFPNFKGDVKIISNVPEKSGLGGSSSLVVSLIKALFKSKGVLDVKPEKIAKLAYQIERKIVGIKGGYQDQWAAAYGGGVNYLEFKKNQIFIEPLWLSEKLMKKLENSLVLFFIGPREGDSGNIHEELEKRVKSKVGKSDIKIMLQRRKNVSKTREALLDGNILLLAKLLDMEQKSKLDLCKNLMSKKSKEIYQTAKNLGAIAGKISGAGAGGCAIFIYQGKNKKKFIKQMGNLGCKHIPLKLQRLNNMGEN